MSGKSVLAALVFAATAIAQGITGAGNVTSTSPPAGITGNQGNGAKLQLSTGSTTTGDAVMFDGNGNTADSGGPALRLATITLSASQVDGMSATPILFIAAQGAGTITRTLTCFYNYTYSSAFAGGGVIGTYYGNADISYPTGGTASSSLLAQTNNASASPVNTLSISASSRTVNAAVYISNATGAFTGGSGSTLTVSCLYYVVTGAN